jgi:hypothetical protein
MMILRALAAGALFCALASAPPSFAAEPTKQPATGKDTSTAETKGPPSATLEVASEEMRLIMGGTAGKGVLHFNGTDYPFSYKSASAGVGGKMVQEMSATGEVYSLTRIEDFEGQYASASTAAMAGSSEMAVTLTNDKGVVVKLQGTVKGVGLSLGAGVATIKLIKQ